jgi:trans-L-3-hydroxyproline dehydratase
MAVDWSPPPEWTRITSIDVHTAGEPLRILTGGIPHLPGSTILEKRRFAREHLDEIRTALMWEPRGHADMYGAILTEPVSDDGDAGVLFLHNEGFSTMCGHGILGLAMAGVEAEVVTPDPAGTLRFDTPAGRVTASTERKEGRPVSASFLNVPSFVFATDETVHVEGLGTVRYDVAFGGAFYAFCQAGELGLELDPGSFQTLMNAGRRIKEAVMSALPIQHPEEPDLGFLYGTIFVGEAHQPGNHSRNVCVFAEGEVDRSPTGTGVSARAALHLARGELEVGEPFTVESILGTTFTGRVEERVRFGPYDAVIPRVEGTSHIIGRNELLLDPDDPLRYGFLLR